MYSINAQLQCVVLLLSFQNIVSFVCSFASQVASTANICKPNPTMEISAFDSNQATNFAKSLKNAPNQKIRVRNHPISLFMSSTSSSETNDNSTSSSSSNGTSKNNGILAQRCLYRFSPPNIQQQGQKSETSTHSTPSPFFFAIEERQCYTIQDDRSLDPLGNRSFIFRGGDTSKESRRHIRHSKRNFANDSFSAYDGDRDSDAHPASLDINGGTIEIGPALYSIQGLEEGNANNENDVLKGMDLWDNYYAMALYCMHNPQFIVGEGIGVGR